MAIDLQQELTQLRRNILGMAASVEVRVNQAIDSLLNRDIATARSVRTSDSEIDRMEVDIEAECLRILALSQPVAGDLRFVLSVIRINNNLERLGDLAKSIAKRTLDLAKLAPIDPPEALERMADETRQMLTNTMQALTDEDVDLAARVRRSDERVDDLQREVFSWIQEEIPQRVERTKPALDLLSAARKMERIADHCTNICEDVIFLSAGEVVRHAAP